MRFARSLFQWRCVLDNHFAANASGSGNNDDNDANNYDCARSNKYSQVATLAGSLARDRVPLALQAESSRVELSQAESS